jgi:predicted dehydrogenase
VRRQSPSRQHEKFLNDKLATEANVYKDYRELLEKEKSLDAVDVATPDHMHAVIAATAIKMGKHVYCQKPLTHDVFEARTLRDLAREHNVATQMGNQGSASDSLRRAVEVMHAGIIGPSMRLMSGPTVRSGRRARTVRRAAILCRKGWIGTFGSAPRRSGPLN